MTQIPKTPPQKFSPGGRRILDAQWLTYLRRTSDIGNRDTLVNSEQLIKGVYQFNEWKFQSCHETWESLWVDSVYPERLFILSLTKFASGFAHALRRNPKGVTRLLDEAIRYIKPFAPSYAGLDIQLFISDVTAWLHSETYSPPFPELKLSN